MKKQTDDLGKYCKIAWRYFQRKQKFDQVQKAMDGEKAEFEAAMAECFDDFAGSGKRIKFDGKDLDSSCSDSLVVSMVERTSIEWNPDKLEKRIPKHIARQVIKKHYSVDNMPGLIEYLKQCNVDPKIFKQFIRAEKYVDQTEVDRLSELGLITVKNISGCYMVKCQKPFFRLKLKKGDGGEGDEK